MTFWRNPSCLSEYQFLGNAGAFIQCCDQFSVLHCFKSLTQKLSSVSDGVTSLYPRLQSSLERSRPGLKWAGGFLCWEQSCSRAGSLGNVWVCTGLESPHPSCPLVSQSEACGTDHVAPHSPFPPVLASPAHSPHLKTPLGAGEPTFGVIQGLGWSKGPKMGLLFHSAGCRAQAHMAVSAFQRQMRTHTRGQDGSHTGRPSLVVYQWGLF